MTLMANGRGNGGRSNDCHALLQTLRVYLLKNLDDGESVLLEAIYRHFLPRIRQTSAQCIMEKAGGKRELFEQEELSFSCMVDEEALRWKYMEQIIHELQGWICNNLYTRDSLNAKDTRRKRDIHRKPSSYH